MNLKPLVFPKGGRIVLARYRSDGTLQIDRDSVVGHNGTVQSIQPTINIQTQDVPDGNADFPMGVYDVAKDARVQITMSSFQPNLYAALLGVDLVTGSENLWSGDESHTIDDEDGTVTLDHAVANDGTVVVFDDSGSPFVKAGSSPGANEFTVDGAELTFHESRKGAIVHVTYEYTPSSVTRLSLPESGFRPVQHVIISGEATNEDQTQLYDVNIVLDKAKAIDEISPPQMQREVQPWNATLRVLRPRPGKKPVDYKFALRS